VATLREAAAGTTVSLEFVVRNLTGAAGAFDIHATAAPGVTGTYSPAALTLAASQTGTVTLQVRVDPGVSPDTVSAAGISATLRGSAGVFDSATTDIRIENRRLAGRIADIVDGGVSGVTLRLSGTVSRSAVSDADGAFAFDDLPAGRYALSASKTGVTLAPASMTIELAESDRSDVVFKASSAGGVRAFRRLFAEGATGSFFDTSFAIFNPSPLAATVRFSFLRDDGMNAVEDLLVPPTTSVRLNPRSSPQLGAAAFSTVVDSTEPVVVERRMSWDASAFGAHAETSLASPSSRWYLAEGATGGFQLFYLLANPWPVEVPVTVTFLRPAPAERFSKSYVLGPNSRLTIPVHDADPRLKTTDVSAVIDAPTQWPIVVERAMYLSGPRTFEGGHASAGITAASPEWFLAEGATGAFFDMFVLIANPSDVAAQVRVEYLLGDGGTIVRNYPVEAGARRTIFVDQEDPRLAAAEVSVVVRATNNVPIVVERAMWWPQGAWTEGHNSAGSTTTGSKWAVGDVRVGGSHQDQTYVLIANTSFFPASVAVTLFLEDGSSTSATVNVAARSRFTVSVGNTFPGARGRLGSVVVEDPSGAAALVVESAVYSDSGHERWAAGTNTLGTRLR
jgi:hypothetical protein